MKLTFPPGASARGESLSVRIPHNQGPIFYGTLARKPASTGLSKLRVGIAIAFTAPYTHSLPKSERALEQKLAGLRA